jgi:hypothetical protein
VFLLLRGVPLLLEIGLTIFCLIECIQTPEGSIRNLPKWGWIVLILVFPLIGSIAWLFAGRPVVAWRGSRVAGTVSGFPEYQRDRAGTPIGPDDDPEYLRELGRVNAEHEQTLQQWEAQLRRREEELRREERRRRDEDPPPAPNA